MRLHVGHNPGDSYVMIFGKFANGELVFVFSCGEIEEHHNTSYGTDIKTRGTPHYVEEAE